MDTIDRLFVGSFILVLFIISTVFYTEINTVKKRHALEDAARPPTISQSLRNEQAKITAYLKEQQGLYPEIIAEACMLTSNPELCAATALVESNANPYTPPGDNGKSKGAFQIQDQHWAEKVGPVSTDPFIQAEQWDAVHTELLDTRSLPGAIYAYNGGSDIYVRKVYSHYRRMLK